MENYKCAQCGIPFQMYRKGFLFIETKLQILLNEFQHLGENLWVASYDSLEAAEILMKKIEEIRLNSGIEINSALSLTEKKPFLFITSENLLQQLENAEIVSTIQTGDLISYLQPIVKLQENNQIYAYESLLRTAGSGFISPGTLFSVATKSGMLSLLDQRAREAAIIAKKNYVPDGIKSFINFLPSTIYNPDFCLRHTFNLVEKYKINPADLVFEVVETEKIVDIDHLKKVLDTYKRQGIKVALDDVGSGFSTLEVLQMLKPDYVKIDRHYIDYCDQNIEKQNFLIQVMELSKSLGITVLGEGIERFEELEFCRQIGVDLAQGYFIGKPSDRPLVEALS